MSVRVRYAPSPTGLQHVGGLRTAVFDYLLARSQGGAFVLRVEDTDRERFDENSLADIYETFDWLGFRWDEGPDVGGAYGPYIQSERLELYHDYAARLEEGGYAYYAYDTPERLRELQEKGEGYDRLFREMPEEEKAGYRDAGIEPVLRFKVPLEGTTTVEDRLLGAVRKKNKDIIADPVLLKSDGYPTYHFAHVVDDHLMQITHVLRGQEWVPSAPLHVLLFEAFGWEAPVFVHLPVILGNDGQKLSKRHGATSVSEFRRKGYLPEALINYVARLGWAYDDRTEIFSLDELERFFSLEGLSKSPAVFDYKKLDWLNGVYIRRRSHGELLDLVQPFLKAENLISSPATEQERRILDGAIPLIHERLKKLSDAPHLLRFLFQEVQEWDMDELVPKKTSGAEALEFLRVARGLLDGLDGRTEEETEELFRNAAEERELKLGILLTPLRVAVTGSRVSPPLFGSLKLLGEEHVMARINRCIQVAERAFGQEGQESDEGNETG